MLRLLAPALLVSVGLAADARLSLERARRALEQNQLAEARAAAAEAVRQDPKSGDAEVILGLVATAAKDFAAAEKHFLRAVALQPGNARVHGYLGSTYLARQRHSEAAVEFAKVLKLDPKSAAALYNLGVIASMQRKPEVALRYFEPLVRSNPTDVAAIGALLQTQLALGRTTDARATASKLQQILPAADPRLHEAGALLAASGDYAGAIPILESAYRSAPGSVDAAYNLALALYRSGNAERAVSVLAGFPRSPQALNLMGTIEESRGRYSEAVQALSQAARLQPSNETFRVDAAAVLLRETDPQPAIASFEAAARDLPRSQRVRLGLGSAYYLSGRYDDAARTFLDALVIDASAPAVYQMLAHVYEAAPDYQDRIMRAFREYLGRAPKDAGAYAAYGRMLLRAKQDSADAIRHLERALQLDPKLSEAYLQLGILAHTKGDYQKAIQTLGNAIKYAPDSAQAHYRLAMAYSAAGDAERSRAEMRVFQQLREKEREQNKDKLLRSLSQDHAR